MVPAPVLPWTPDDGYVETHGWMTSSLPETGGLRSRDDKVNSTAWRTRVPARPAPTVCSSALRSSGTPTVPAAGARSQSQHEASGFR